MRRWNWKHGPRAITRLMINQIRGARLSLAGIRLDMVITKCRRKPRRTFRQTPTESDGSELVILEWWMTRDNSLLLVRWLENDQTSGLTFSDRKKDLVKLRNGEYIALGNIESCLKTSPLCDNLCIFADQNEISCVAVAVMNARKVQELAKSLRLGNDFSRLNTIVNTSSKEATSRT